MGLASLLPLIGGLFSAFGGAKAGQQASQSDALANQQAGILGSEYSRLQGLRQKYYDPMLTNTVIPGLMSRLNNGPFYAPDAMAQSRSLRTPFYLDYKS